LIIIGSTGRDGIAARARDGGAGVSALRALNGGVGWGEPVSALTDGAKSWRPCRAYVVDGRQFFDPVLVPSARQTASSRVQLRRLAVEVGRHCVAGSPANRKTKKSFPRTHPPVYVRGNKYWKSEA
jgi:hypothetical protein